MTQLVASMSSVVLGGVAEVVGSNVSRGKIFTISPCIYLLCKFVSVSEPVKLESNDVCEIIFPHF